MLGVIVAVDLGVAMRQGLAVSAAVAVLVLVGASPALANGNSRIQSGGDPSWALQTVPNGSGNSGDDVLGGVSCPGTSTCVASGSYLTYEGDIYVQVTLAELWTGSSWTIQSTPNKQGASGDLLGADSCPTVTMCVAVGEYSVNTTADETLAEEWNGNTWSLMTTPDPSGGAYLNGVSCVSTTDCISVGSYFSSDRPVAQKWNGTKWSATSVPVPSGGGSLSWVSCSSAKFCMAVGGTAGFGAFADYWNGSKWTEDDPPPPTDGAASGLTSVSCTSASACIAVGGVLTSSEEDQTLAYQWNGSAWTQLDTLDPGSNSDFTGVSCATATSCIAVGAHIGSSGSQALAEEWNGIAWSIQTMPQPDGTASPQSVSCTTAALCSAVGSYMAGGIGSTLNLAYRYS
jgi:hypothetical protein